MSAPRLAVLADLLEESWPSMDLVAEMLVAHLDRRTLDPVLVRPAFARRLSLLGRAGRNADRLLNRVHDYPRAARRLASAFDFFHVADHSYGTLVRALPAERTGVFCHDLDAFRCVLEPAAEARSLAHRLLARALLRGLGRAGVVFTATETLRDELARRGLVDPGRIVVAPYGVADELFEPGAEPPPATKYVLHVGSCIARKRIDVLLEVFARLRARRPGLELFQVGGAWTEEQRAKIERLGIACAVRQERGIDRRALARRYRGASAVLLPSEREGFGLPVLEALACGAPVVASDLATVREVGGDLLVYCRVGDVAAWTDAVGRVLADAGGERAREARAARARGFTWQEHAAKVARGYLGLVARRASASGV